MNSISFPKLAILVACVCVFPNFLSAQEDLLPSPDELFTPLPQQQVSDTVVDSQQMQTETVDELPPLDELPPVDALPSVEFTPDSNEPEVLPAPIVEESDEVQTETPAELPAVETQEIVEEVSVTNAAPDQESVVSYPVSVKPEHNGWAFSVHGGSNLFYGDLRIYPLWPAKQYNNERKWAFGASLDKEFNKYLQLRGTVLYGTLSGTKREYESGAPANLYFDATLLEYSGALKLTLGAENPLSFYTYVGLGFVQFRTQRKDLRTNKVLASYGYDGTKKIDPTIETMAPVGFGFDYKITDNLSANIDISLRIVNTDKLDATISNSTPFFQDMYGYSAFGLTYTFGRKQVNAVPSMVEPLPVVEEEIVPEVLEEEVVEEVLVEVEEVVPVEPELPLFEEPVVQEVIDPIADPIPAPIPEPVVMPEPQPVVPETTPAPITETVEGVTYQNVSTQTGLVYRVQILAVQTAKDNKVAQLHRIYQLNETIYEEQSGVWYKYTVGSFATLQEASAHRLTLIQKGLKDCFVVPYYNGSRITLQQARDLK